MLNFFNVSDTRVSRYTSIISGGKGEGVGFLRLA